MKIQQFINLYHCELFVGLYSMPIAKSGKPLPSPRLISSKLFQDNPTVNQIHTMLSAHWGQMIAHDLSMGVIEQTSNLINLNYTHN